MNINNEVKPRLEVKDKRVLFQSLLAMTERLLFLNKFPVDQQDFALSMLDPEVEAAWRLLKDRDRRFLSYTPTFDYNAVIGGKERLFFLHEYPSENAGGYYHHIANSKQFPVVRTDRKGYGDVTLDADNEHFAKVQDWAEKQVRLEDQIKRTMEVVKELVHQCNTIGQWHRVSPELITFIPEKYRIALRDYTKKSPKSKLTAKKEDIDRAITTIAYAALQPQHYCESKFAEQLNSWGRPRYELKQFPRTANYTTQEFRHHEL
jgi:hypothetical protein